MNLMTQTVGMKKSNESFDVFEFKEEDDQPGMAVKKFFPKFGYSHAVDVSKSGIKVKEIDIGICKSGDVDIDYNRAAGGSLIPVENADSIKDTPELSHILQSLHNDFKSYEQGAEKNSKIIEPPCVFASLECISSLDADMRLKDNLNVAVRDSLCSARSVHMASDADENISERSPSAVGNTSSDGPSSDKCSSGWNMPDEKVGIVFYPDYIDYCGTHYMDSVVRFSRSFIEARSKTMYENERTFQIQLEIDDIVRIESQWSAGYETGIINIYFISKDGVKDGIVHNASAVQELKFPLVDMEWYQKQEAIRSLHVYKALWSVLLDSGIEKNSPLREGEDMMQTKSYFPKFDRPFEEVIYPKGDPDAVSINKRDVDLLLPDTFVNDTIIDFYIKYLKSRQNAEERTKFHFFNSFFFRKLADLDKDPSSAFDGKAAFLRVRKWTRKINLLEKDFIFIPVNFNYHWSLIVICYFGEVASYKDGVDGKPSRVPCILHMDSLRGTHNGLKDLLQSYLWEEWKERLKETSEDLCSNFRNLKFIPLELPQQQNSYDCGLFLLHYVELFLEEVPTNFNIYKITSSSKFLQEDWFPPGEASMKRTRIERLINDLLVTQSEDCLNMTNGYDNGVEFSVESSPSSGCREKSSLGQVGQGIKMTWLPTRSAQSPVTTSRLVLKELFKQTSAPEPFNDEHWGALVKTPVPMTEKKLDANECFVQEELEETVFPYSSGDFRLNSSHQHTPDGDVSSPVTSGSDSHDDIVEVETDDEKSRTPVEPNDPDRNESFFLNEFYREANQLHNQDTSHLTLDVGPLSDGKSDVLESVIPCDEAHPHSDGLMESDGQRCAKRMRISSADGGEEITKKWSEDLRL